MAAGLARRGKDGFVRVMMPLLTPYTLHVASAVDPALMRLSRGRLRIMPVRSLVLHTIGAKSGKPRDTTLGYLPQGEGYVVFATNGGRPSLPGWYHNICREPEVAVSVRGRRINVYATDVAEDDWEAVWSQIVAWQPALNLYRARLDGVRRIPLVQLTPR